MSDQSYAINEIFYSLQGEGVRAGTANLFLRFTGCNQTCRKETHGFDCDTEFASGRRMTLDEILAEFRQAGPGCEWVILTGGEPALQVDRELIDALHAAGYKLAIETNGSIELPPRHRLDHGQPQGGRARHPPAVRPRGQIRPGLRPRHPENRRAGGA